VKKWITAGLLVLLLAGCSEEETTKQEPAKKLTVEEKTEKKVEVQVEVTDHVYYKWNDESIGNMEQITFYAKIENTGNKPVDVMDTKLTYKNNDGSVIGTMENSDLYMNIHPSVIAPGQSSYIAISVDGDESFKDFKEVTVDVKPVEFDGDVVELKTDKVNVKKSDEWGGMVGVTGYIKNETDKPADQVQLASALYDKEGKFIGALLPGSDQSFQVEANGETSFDLGIPGFPSDQVENVEKAEVISSYVDYGEM